VKIIAKIIVSNVPKIAPALFEANKAWWPQVIVAPLLSNNKVLSNGIAKGFKGWIPKGGQEFPNSIAGVNALWKNAQNILRKAKAKGGVNRVIKTN